MVDDKKDLDNDYSALSDALDTGDRAPSLEDLLKDHGIDLGSDTDLDAMQDFSLNDDVPARAEEKPSSMSLDDFHTDEDLFADSLFDDSPKEASFVERSKPMEPMGKKAPVVEEAMFETSDFTASDFEASDFDETSPDFDPNASGAMSNDDALFDYDPHTEAAFADVGGADPESEGGDLGSDGMPPPPSDKAPGVKRMMARLGVMFVLVTVIYGGLRLFIGEKQPNTTVAEPTLTAPPPSKIAQLPESKTLEPAPAATEPSAPVATAEIAVSPEATAAVPDPAIPDPAATVAQMPPSNLPVPGAVASGLPTTTPVVTAADMREAVASPATSLDVAVPVSSIPGATMAPTASTNAPTPIPLAAAPASAPSSMSLGTGDVNDKLNNLELALKSIDERLAQVGGSGMGDEKLQRLERLVNDSSAPEMQAVLEEAVRKMKELDRKLERIGELQQQVRKLDTDVKMLKEDVVMQTNVVGEQQRLFNDNVQMSQMQEPGPVKMVVQAAIPGRAWLRSERGELLTVIPGDEVPGYGRVVSIDAASGTVVTSSRAVFREQ